MLGVTVLLLLLIGMLATDFGGSNSGSSLLFGFASKSKSSAKRWPFIQNDTAIVRCRVIVATSNTGAVELQQLLYTYLLLATGANVHNESSLNWSRRLVKRGDVTCQYEFGPNTNVKFNSERARLAYMLLPMISNVFRPEDEQQSNANDDVFAADLFFGLRHDSQHAPLYAPPQHQHQHKHHHHHDQNSKDFAGPKLQYDTVCMLAILLRDPLTQVNENSFVFQSSHF